MLSSHNGMKLPKIDINFPPNYLEVPAPLYP